MVMVYSYGGPPASMDEAVNVLASWRLYGGTSFPSERNDYAVIFFEDQSIRTWLIFQAVRVPSGGKTYIYTRMMIDLAPAPRCTAITVDVAELPLFEDIIGELENWIIEMESDWTPEKRSEIFSDVLKGIAVLAS